MMNIEKLSDVELDVLDEQFEKIRAARLQRLKARSGQVVNKS
jgi:hypothetical protein